MTRDELLRAFDGTLSAQEQFYLEEWTKQYQYIFGFIKRQFHVRPMIGGTGAHITTRAYPFGDSLYIHPSFNRRRNRNEEN